LEVDGEIPLALLGKGRIIAVRPGPGKLQSIVERDMLPLVCRCCGAAIEVRATDNPNICQACASTEWVSSDSDFQPEVPLVFRRGPVSLGKVTGESEQFLEIEGPSVVECFDAVEQAKRAIAESLAEEEAAQVRASQSHKSTAPARRSP
jgi:hypothetical protein